MFAFKRVFGVFRRFGCFSEFPSTSFNPLIHVCIHQRQRRNTYATLSLIFDSSQKCQSHSIQALVVSYHCLHFMCFISLSGASALWITDAKSKGQWFKRKRKKALNDGQRSLEEAIMLKTKHNGMPSFLNFFCFFFDGLLIFAPQA
jgi:hypothetical protein